MSAPGHGATKKNKRDDANKVDTPLEDMKEENGETSTAPSSTPPAPSTPAGHKKRKRNDDDEAEDDVNDSLDKGKDLVDSPEEMEAEEKKAKRVKMPEEAKDANTTGKGKKSVARKGSLEGEASVLKLLQGIVEPLGDLKKSLRTGSTAVSSLLGAISGQVPASAGASGSSKSAGAYQLYIWGKLVAQQPKNVSMSVSLSGPSFSIGGNSRCSLTISDPGIGSSVVCKLQNSFSTGVVQIEGQTSRNILFVNLKPLKKGARQPIKTGDEISIITKQQTYSFAFQKVRSPSAKQTSTAAVPSLPSLSLLAGGPGAHHLSLAPAAPTPSSTSPSSSSSSASTSGSSSQAASTSSSSTSSSSSSSASGAEVPDAGMHTPFFHHAFL